MGGGFYDSSTYDSLKSSYKSKSTDDIFTSNKTRSISTDMDPKGLTVRESRDSDDHPQSLAIIVALDETGSMGDIPEIIARSKLGTLMSTLINNEVKDAHVLFLGIGDHLSDNYPLQVGQFEAETKLLDKWLTSIYLEGNGGGQNRESYTLAWLIAGRHTSIDCFEKRGQKGFLFTIGDEAAHPKIQASKLKDILGYAQSDDVTDDQLLQEASRMYHIFHLHCEQGSYPTTNSTGEKIFDYWRSKLGERAMKLPDYNNICEVIATIVATISGADMDKVVASFDTKTALMVKNTIGNASNSLVHNKDNPSVILF